MFVVEKTPVWRLASTTTFFTFKQKLLVRKFGVTLRDFPAWISKKILVRRSTGRMSISYFKETA